MVIVTNQLIKKFRKVTSGTRSTTVKILALLNALLIAAVVTLSVIVSYERVKCEKKVKEMSSLFDGHDDGIYVSLQNILKRCKPVHFLNEI